MKKKSINAIIYSVLKYTFKGEKNMDINEDFAVAIDAANRKIAELNVKLIKNKTEELQTELNKWLTIKEEIYKGNVKLIKKIINNEM